MCIYGLWPEIKLYYYYIIIIITLFIMKSTTVVPATAGHRWFGAKVAGRGRWPLVTGNGHMRHYVKSSKYIRQHTFRSTCTTL